MTTPANPPSACPPVDSQLVVTLLGGKFALTAEVVPPLSGNRDDFLELITPLKGCVDAVNIADSAGGKVRLPGLACVALMKGCGIEPVLQVTCRDRNKSALISDLIGAGALDVHNLLVLRGDEIDPHDHPDITAVHDVTPTELINIASCLTNNGSIPAGSAMLTNEGLLPSQLSVASPPRFFIGGADVPAQCDENWWAGALKKKIQAGAHFIQTQLTYDIGTISRYAEQLQNNGLIDEVFILIGTGPLASAKSALWMRNNLWGVNIPDKIITRLEDARDPRREGIKICTEILHHISDTPGLAGAHLMAPGNNEAIPETITQAGVSSNGLTG